MLQIRFVVIALLLTGCSLIASESDDKPALTPNNEKTIESQKDVAVTSKAKDPEVNMSSVPPRSLPEISSSEPPKANEVATPIAPNIAMPSIVPSSTTSATTSSKSDTNTSKSEISPITDTSLPNQTISPKPAIATSKSDASSMQSATIDENPPTTATSEPDASSPKSATIDENPPTAATSKLAVSSPKSATIDKNPLTTTSQPDDSSTQSTSTGATPTSTSSAPSTTTTPKPYPQPSVGQWNSSCIMVKMAAQLNVTYLTQDEKNATVLYNIPQKATVNDSNCADVTQTIQINWGSPEAVNSMLLQFDLKEKTSELTMLRFIIAIVGDAFPNALENQTLSLIHRGKDFAAPLQMSYHCTRSQNFNLTETLVESVSQSHNSVTVHDVQVEAFRKPNSASNFSAVHDCDGADTPDIVPIAVGIALVAMIMIILTSYLCARRRSNLRGYMSF